MTGASTPDADGAARTLEALAPRAVEVADIERELTRLWRHTQGPVTRACMSNLIVFCSTPEEAELVSHDFGSIVEHHPARLLLLIGDATEQMREVEAYVSARCHLGDRGRQVCSEHVTVSACGDATRRLASVARPLLVGDLPTALWWLAGDAPPLAGDVFRELAVMADQVIYDSSDWPDAARGVVATAHWSAHERSVPITADLAWRRLKPWRRLVSQSLDPALVPGALWSIRDVVLEHGAQGLPQVWFFVGWLARCLGWQYAGVKGTPDADAPSWEFRSPSGPLGVTVRRVDEGDAGLRSVAISSNTSGRRQTVRFERTGPQRLQVTIEGAPEPPRVLVSPEQTRATLVARQLPDRQRDNVFLDALELARVLAEVRPA